MFNRFLSWCALCVFCATLSLRAQVPAPAPASQPPPGTVRVAQVRNSAFKMVAGIRTALKRDDTIEQAATVYTERNSSIVLAFSNGATTQLGDDSELVIEEFLQNPFPTTIAMDLVEEPTRSNTRLRLNKGELIGKVAKLKHDLGSTFTVNTPVGAAGIRGTTFRIVFRPQGTGMAFFQLSTVEGNVNFSQSSGPAAPGGGNVGGAQGQGATPNQPDPNQPQGQGPAPGGQGPGGSPGGGGGGGGLPVVGGQEVVIQVSVNVTPSGQVVITAPPQVTTTVPISGAVQAQIVQQAQQIAVVVATMTFTPSPTTGAPPGTGGGGSTGTPGTSGDATGTPSGTPPGAGSPTAPVTPTTPPPPTPQPARITPGG